MMGSPAAPTLPCLDLTQDAKALDPGTKEWTVQCHRLREALETYGFALVNYDRLSMREMHEEMLTAMQSLFDLQPEIKRRNATPGFYFTYVGPSVRHPHYEMLGVVNAATDPDASRDFTNLMWPGGKDGFSKTMYSMSKEMVELARIVVKMIFDSYGAGSGYESRIEGTDGVLRMMRYTAPGCMADHDQQALGLTEHTDPSYVTLVCQLNGVDGLSFKSKQGEWLQVTPPQGSFLVSVGQSLQAWSNGRLHCPLHKVMLTGDKDRYSCGMYLIPKQEKEVEAPEELVDEKHPRLYKPFTYIDFLKYAVANGGVSEGILDKFVGSS